jgi:hypothetical protein
VEASFQTAKVFRPVAGMAETDRALNEGGREGRREGVTNVNNQSSLWVCAWGFDQIRPGVVTRKECQG